MQTVKRLEIITDGHRCAKCAPCSNASSVTGYSVVHNVTGRGERGEQSGDEITGVFTNALLITTCAPERLPELSKRSGRSCAAAAANAS